MPRINYVESKGQMDKVIDNQSLPAICTNALSDRHMLLPCIEKWLLLYLTDYPVLSVICERVRRAHHLAPVRHFACLASCISG